MTEPTLDEILQQAFEHHRNGQLEEAAALYQAVLQIQPDHPDASENLRQLFSQQLADHLQEAQSLYRTIMDAGQNQKDDEEPDQAH
ncbi:hypothetical protein CCR95_08520 [Thiocystis minor]|uniref:tetratricopeptide repeat protein n=1 Tax=Thiocystis minor TaxID=61597 RepID=UPI0019125736|nr:tetratricopeptide repeat protein [Thiocystis minor]MBK5964127.1 hypothetical protein [Thiocystis minor]